MKKSRLFILPNEIIHRHAVTFGSRQAPVAVRLITTTTSVVHFTISCIKTASTHRRYA